jgi:hypothetical protein
VGRSAAQKILAAAAAAKHTVDSQAGSAQIEASPAAGAPVAGNAAPAPPPRGIMLALVSHCSAANCRQLYLQELITAVAFYGYAVDSFGKCMQNKERPPDFPGRDDYLEDLEFTSRYPFTFAFENANCPGYITEKLRRPLLAGSVPIVYAPAAPANGNPANYGSGAPTVPDYSTLAPAGSTINAAAFPTAYDLARYLVHLVENPAELAAYHTFTPEDFEPTRATAPAAGSEPVAPGELSSRSAGVMGPGVVRPWVFDAEGNINTCGHQLANWYHSMKGRRRHGGFSTEWGCLENYAKICHKASIAKHLVGDAPPPPTRRAEKAASGGVPANETVFAQEKRRERAIEPSSNVLPPPSPPFGRGHIITPLTGCHVASYVVAGGQDCDREVASPAVRLSECADVAAIGGRAGSMPATNGTATDGTTTDMVPSIYVEFTMIPYFVRHLLPCLRTPVVLLSGNNNLCNWCCSLLNTPGIDFATSCPYGTGASQTHGVADALCAFTVQRLLTNPLIVHWWAHNVWTGTEPKLSGFPCVVFLKKIYLFIYVVVFCFGPFDYVWILAVDSFLLCFVLFGCRCLHDLLACWQRVRHSYLYALSVYSANLKFELI